MPASERRAATIDDIQVCDRLWPDGSQFTRIIEINQAALKTPAKDRVITPQVRLD